MSAHPEARRQLPARARVFVDRTAELAEFRSAAADATERSEPLLWAFTGQEGVGKTTLAVMACYEIAEASDDLHLFHDFRGQESGIDVAPEEAAGAFLRKLGFTGEQIPASSAERFTVLRSALAGRKVLLFLDDVRSVNQVEPLLFESGVGAVVVTSRRPLSPLRRLGFTISTVREFHDEPAAELMTRLAGERFEEIGPEILKGVREVCEGLPLALSIAGSQLADVEEPADYLARLVGEKAPEVFELEGERPVKRIFDLRYRDLAPGEALAYVRLSLLPGPHFGVGVAAAILDTQEEDARRTLRSLARHSILGRVGEDRYRFHALVRADARDRARAELSPVRIAAAISTARWWYWRRQVALDQNLSNRPAPVGAQAHYQSIEPAFRGPDAERRAWAEVELEWPNLLAAMAEDGGPQDELASVFPLALWFYGYQTRQCTELIDAYQRALQERPEPAEAWQLYRDLAGLYERIGDSDAADDCVAQGQELGYEPGIESLHEWHGLARERRGDRAGALDAFRRAWDAVPLMTDPEQQIRARALLYMHSGRIHRALSVFDEAVANLTEAHGYFADHDESLNQARVDLDLGACLARTHRFDAADPLLRSAFTEFRERSIHDKAAEAADELARIAEAQGRTDEAEEWNQLSRELRG